MMEPHDCNFHGELRVRINDRCPLHRAMHNLARCLRDAGALCAADGIGQRRAIIIEENVKRARSGWKTLDWWFPGCGKALPGVEGVVSEHDIKTWPAPFQAVLDGTKRHEIRKDDRGYAVGDVLRLREWDPTIMGAGLRNGSHFEGTTRGYTGRSIRVRVTYKSDGGTWGLPDGLCVMSIEPACVPDVPSRSVGMETSRDPEGAQTRVHDAPLTRAALTSALTAVASHVDGPARALVTEIAKELSNG